MRCHVKSKERPRSRYEFEDSMTFSEKSVSGRRVVDQWNVATKSECCHLYKDILVLLFIFVVALVQNCVLLMALSSTENL